MEPISPADDNSTPKTTGLSRKIRNIDVPLMARRGIFHQGARDWKDLSSKMDSQGSSADRNSELLLSGVRVFDQDKYDDTNAIPTVVEKELNKEENLVAPLSYAETVKENVTDLKMNFRVLPSESMEGVDVVLPKASVKAVHDRCKFTLYGYFLGKRLAYPVVEYFVTHNWSKFGLQKVMMNADGFFFFKFADETGMNDVLKEGPWLIRNVPIFLNTWNPSIILKKDEVTNVAVWVKIHNVPIVAYSEDGLSMIVTKIGKPRMMDTISKKMCKDSWGRSSFARALVEISADKALKEEISIAIPDLEGDGYHTEYMKVEYEWKPLRCGECCVFGHDDLSCPKRPKAAVVAPVLKNDTKVVDADGFQLAKSKGKRPIVFQTSKPKFVYKPVVKKSEQVPKETSKTFVTNSFATLFDVRDNMDNLVIQEVEKSSSAAGVSGVKPIDSNPFSVLSDLDADLNGDGVTGKGPKIGMSLVDEEDSEVDEVMIMNNETSQVMDLNSENKGASTPSGKVNHV